MNGIVAHRRARLAKQLIAQARALGFIAADVGMMAGSAHEHGSDLADVRERLDGLAGQVEALGAALRVTAGVLRDE